MGDGSGFRCEALSRLEREFAVEFPSCCEIRFPLGSVIAFDAESESLFWLRSTRATATPTRQIARMVKDFGFMAVGVVWFT